MNLLRIRATLWRMRFLFLAIAALSCVAAVLSTISSLAPPRSPAAILTTDVPAGHKLTAQDIRIVDIPDDLRPSGSITTLEKAIGSTTTAALPRGMPLSSSLFLSSEFFAQAPAGHTIIAVAVRTDGTEELLIPGARATIYAPPHEVGGEAVLVAPLAVIVGKSAGAETSGFLAQSEPTLTAYVAIPHAEATALLAYEATTPMRIVLHSAGRNEDSEDEQNEQEAVNREA